MVPMEQVGRASFSILEKYSPCPPNLGGFLYDSKTKLFGILGFPLGHTRSPLVHNTLFQLSGTNALYLVLEREDWRTKGLEPLEILGFQGLSVTIPLKEWAFQKGEWQCPASMRMKASNTLVWRNRWEAWNTDGDGALDAIKENSKDSLEGKILVIGSGGSARGILEALTRELNYETQFHILARNKEAVSSLSALDDRIKSVNLTESMDSRGEYSLIIQTTPLGMTGKPKESPLPKDFFQRDQTVFDIVYDPVNTPLVEFANQSKCRIIPGYKMLLFQAYRQFELFTGNRPNAKDMHLVEELVTKSLNA